MKWGDFFRAGICCTPLPVQLLEKSAFNQQIILIFSSETEMVPLDFIHVALARIESVFLRKGVMKLTFTDYKGWLAISLPENWFLKKSKNIGQ